MMASQVMVPAPFYYYNPDPTPDNRQHGQFSQQPAMQQMHMYPAVPTLPSTPVYSRPSSSCSQPAMQSKMLSAVPSNLTPMASPQMAYQRPTIMLQNCAAKLMLETELYDDNGYYPATPALSTSGSNVGSPGSSQDMLSTPLNPMFSGLDGYENIKPDVETMPEALEGLDWSNCASPPMTPGEYTLFVISVFIANCRARGPAIGGSLSWPHLTQRPPRPKTRHSGPRLVLAGRRSFLKLANDN